LSRASASSAFSGSRLPIVARHDLADRPAAWRLERVRRLAEQFDSTWAVFTDLIDHPTFDPVNVAGR
jgi:hypothetical protein